MVARPTAGAACEPAPPRWKLSPWAWALIAVFALFALRSFCFLVYSDGKQLAIGSPDNLGDLSLHMQMAQFFANGATWWPAHPEAASHTLRYYPGIDLFESLLLLVGANNLQVLVWMGLVGSAAALLALFRWGGSFTVAGFLFSGGLAGFQFFQAFEIADYQHELAWKSLPLTIFVTQRPFLFALPAGLLLLIHWRREIFLRRRRPPRDGHRPDRGRAVPTGPGVLPFWVEALLYAAMPVFHLFAFVFLSLLLGWWFVLYFGRTAMRWHLLEAGWRGADARDDPARADDRQRRRDERRRDASAMGLDEPRQSEPGEAPVFRWASGC